MIFVNSLRDFTEGGQAPCVVQTKFAAIGKSRCALRCSRYIMTPAGLDNDRVARLKAEKRELAVSSSTTFNYGLHTPPIQCSETYVWSRPLLSRHTNNAIVYPNIVVWSNASKTNISNN